MIARLIAAPPGERPLRTVVDTAITAGVRELNAAYDQAHAQLLASLAMTAAV